MRTRARGLLAAALLCAPAVAQTPAPATKPILLQVVQAKPVPVPMSMPSALPPVVQAKAVAVEASDTVKVEVRVLTVSGKESRAAVAKLFKGKDKEKTACLAEKQLMEVLETCAADPSTTVMQAPRVCALAGEPATVAVCESQFFTTALTTKVVDGQVVFVPQNEAMETGTTFTATATPSADGKFVKLKLTFRDKQPKATIPMFPVTTFITPEFVGGKKGEPVPFTQFVQVPAFDEVKLDRTATIPNGGTLAVPAGTRTVATKTESKVPVLGDLPFLGRLFRDTGIGEEECDVIVFATATRVKAAEPAMLFTASLVVPADPETAKMVSAYRKACASGNKDEAMRLAVQALAKDPTCFGK